MKLPFRSAVVLLLLAGCNVSKEGAGGTAAGSQGVTLDGSLTRGWTAADEEIRVPIWLGDEDHGALVMPMWRGAAAGIEDYIFTPPDHDCANARGLFRLDWNAATNTVRYQLKFKKVPVKPEVKRTEGVDFFFNPWHDAAKDFKNGGYRFWTILSAQGLLNDFYYDAATLLLVGSEWDFPGGQPAGTIKISVPVFALQASRLMFPDPDGQIFHEYTVPYDHPTVEGGAYSFGLATYLPLDLCEGHPVQPTLGQLRTWVSPWLPPNQPGYQFTFKDLLERGLVFDTTVDENKPFPQTDGYLPYIFSGVAFIGNEPVFQGGIPSGYRNNLGAVILQVAPGIVPLQGGNGPGCHSSVVDPQYLHGPRFCEMH
ncbi:MAG TPA: hypothetical protein VFB81_09490 [Myxococcales bacterium]|nr:hypothetical protein [Myxococcales bacterium]